MQGRYHVDPAQSHRVEITALSMLAQVATAWQLEDPLAEQLLSWSTRLHEIGLDVSHPLGHALQSQTGPPRWQRAAVDMP